MTASDPVFLIVGATGTQGSATTRSLLAAGRRVRILTRNPQGAVARELQSLGAQAAQGDLDDSASLAAALDGVHGVFSVLRPDVDGSDSERRHGFALVEAARRAGVAHFVHSGVCQAGTHEGFPRWGEGYWAERYWIDKWEVEEKVRGAGFAHWTLLRPSFIMQNFTTPKADFLFPQLRRERLLLSPVLPDVPMQLIAGEDIGAFAAAAFAAPALFGGQTIELAGDRLTFGEVAQVFTEVFGKPVAARSVSPQQAIDAGINPRWVRAQEWTNAVGYRVDTSLLPRYGVKLTPFSEWVRSHRGDIAIED